MRIDATTAQSLLGLPLGADSPTIRSAYRSRIREGHPDTGTDRPADLGALRAARDTLLEAAPDRARHLPARRPDGDVIDLRDPRPETRSDPSARRATQRRADHLFGGYAELATSHRRPAYGDPHGLGTRVDLLL